MDPRLNGLTPVVECTCRAIIDRGHPLSVEAAGGEEHLVFEVDGEPDDEGLILAWPCHQGTAPHGHTRLTAVLACEKPFAAVMRVVRDADESAMAGEGGGHA
jgi:hypothetical protein